MKVLKFGGTSVGSPERIQHVADLVTADQEQKVVVLSAMSGTTNSLVEISDYLQKQNPEAANNIINRLRNLYCQHQEALYSKAENVERMTQFVKDVFHELHALTRVEWSERIEKEILAKGELISSQMLTTVLEERGINVCLIPALEYMVTDENGEPDMKLTEERLRRVLSEHPGHALYVTQGYICRDAEGFVSNLQRGGSDYSASIIGALLRAEEIQIWTDIDGMHTTDPRFVEGTRPVEQLNFEEAAELAYFGAKILHPTCIQPARYAGVPVRLLNTMDPTATGTYITAEMRPGGIKAVAAKDHITAIKIVSSRMLMAYGFLRKVFEIFEKYRTGIDMITTSEVGVSVTIDDTSRLAAITEELRRYGTVEVDHDMCIICCVGDLPPLAEGLCSQAIAAVSHIPLRMISYGGSNHNVSFLLRSQDKQEALRSLNEALF